jgi:non-ribosomal peptide synthetase component F
MAPIPTADATLDQKLVERRQFANSIVALVASLVATIVLDEATVALCLVETGSMAYGVLGALAWGAALFLVTGVVLIRLLN